VTWEPLILSLEVAVLATILATVIGTALATLLVWKKMPARDLVDAVISAPLVLPPTVLGYYLFTLLGRTTPLGRAWESIFGSSIVFTFTGAVIAATVGSLPLVVRSARVGLESVSPQLVDAARTLGAAPRRVFFTVVLPLAMPGVLAGGMLGFARALGDYGITAMVAGGRIDGIGVHQSPTASIYVMNAVDANRDGDAFWMAMVTTIVGVGMLYLANRLSKNLHRA
jgi:molybdate transport system permease protein